MYGQDIINTSDRMVWRKWLSENFDSSDGVWVMFPMKSSGEKGMLYNDAVEEALCFGWIDSTIRNLDDGHRIQHFTPRRKGSSYSRLNIERLIRLDSLGLLHPSVKEEVLPLITAPYEFPEDIMSALRSDEAVWRNFCGFSEPYKRIRIAYIDAARNRPEEFSRRLESFVSKTRAGRMIRGYGGTDLYY